MEQATSHGGSGMGQEQNQTKEKDWRQLSILSISEDAMEAHLTLWPTAEEEGATEEEIVALLKSRNIVYGIQTEEIRRMLEEKLYLEDICVAKGTPAVQGKAGEFEFFIEVQRERHPKIREDGSVDYSDYDAVTLVSKDQLLVRYHPATGGQDGMTVKGMRLVGKRGSEKPMIKGKGFYTSQDKTEYYAEIDGRAECTNGYMVVSHVLEIHGDVDFAYGNVDFAGDVKIYGDVITKMRVKASGFITVEGHVEGAQLISGKGVILKNGMQGSGIGSIDSKGDVEGKFFEQANIRSAGSLYANAILNCKIEAAENVILEGFLAALVGGRIHAGSCIEAANIGNISYTTTQLFVGTSGQENTILQNLGDKIEAETKELNKIEEKLKLLDSVDMAHAPNGPKLMEVKKELLRDKIRIASEINDKENQRKELSLKKTRAVGARVVVHKQVYPGTQVMVNGAYMKVPDIVNDGTIRKKGNEACMFSNKS